MSNCIEIGTRGNFKNSPVRIERIYNRAQIEFNHFHEIFKYPYTKPDDSNESFKETNFKKVLFDRLYPNVKQMYELIYTNNETDTTAVGYPPDYKDDDGMWRSSKYIFDTEISASIKDGKCTFTQKEFKRQLLGGRKTRRKTKRKRNPRKSKRHK
jgi:hypothetical protein